MGRGMRVGAVRKARIGRASVKLAGWRGPWGGGDVPLPQEDGFISGEAGWVMALESGRMMRLENS